MPSKLVMHAYPCRLQRSRNPWPKVLETEGYIGGFSVEGDAKQTMTIDLKYYEGKPVIERIVRVSRPGLRQYRGTTELPK